MPEAAFSINPSPPPELIHPGWLSIDFGTSSSTVALFDPRTISFYNGLSQEQEQFLRRKFLQWLESPIPGGLPNVSHNEWEYFVKQIRKNSELEETSSLRETLQNGSTSQLLEVIRQIEKI
ncbi:hypothetical protein F7734_44300 [Scytonema sp. UIC 10036]|uniref:hypothetical protein n=1 Tax=Scytonema sp. UIC 10036 TaxID=2304196 RepID=UPI0012DA7E4F|nr:hypothetical protein [Scytonema sp. UIC 10036]MUG98946.1 hypothetical protein [Scytonema sp. UIC 10036]